MSMDASINIPGYRIIRLIGKGGMAKVYLAQKEGITEPIALKIIDTELSEDRNFQVRFQKEVQILGNLRHPHIVRYYGAGKYKNHVFMAIEYVPGQDLKKRIRGNNVSQSEIVRWYKQIAQALDYSHVKGYIHRDIKPENVLLRADGSAVLTDFGIAKAKHSATQITGTGLSIGTPYYMSPEQARGKKITAKTDIYSAGVMLFELLTGHVPFSGDDPIAIGISHITKPVPDLPREFIYWQPIINRMMAKNEADRYTSLTQASEEIQALERSTRLTFSGSAADAERIRKTLIAPSSSSNISTRKINTEKPSSMPLKAIKKEAIRKSAPAPTQYNMPSNAPYPAPAPHNQGMIPPQAPMPAQQQAPQAPRATRPRRPRKPLPWFKIFAVLVIFGVGAGAYYAYNQGMLAPVLDEFKTLKARLETLLESEDTPAPTTAQAPRQQAPTQQSSTPKQAPAPAPITATTRPPVPIPVPSAPSAPARPAAPIPTPAPSAPAPAPAPIPAPSSGSPSSAGLQLVNAIRNNMVNVPGQSFQISRFEVSTDQYNTYARATGVSGIQGAGSLPARGISYTQALAFIRYLNQNGGRFSLPTQSQWISAMTSNSPQYDYAWGFENDGLKRYAVCLSADCRGRNLQSVSSGVESTILGIYHAHGNVAEWTSTCSGGRCVVIGGGYSDRPSALKISGAQRVSQTTQNAKIGMRLIQR